MTSSEIMNFLCMISETPSNNDKIDWLRELLEDDDFRRVIQLAYDPYVTFGINNLSFVTAEPGFEDFDEGTFMILNDLSKRIITGNSAKDIINTLFSKLNRPSRALFQYILEKDLKAGFHAKMINKAYPKLIPVPGYMRCSLPKETNIFEWPWLTGVISQEKLNGSFLNVTFNDSVQLMTRKGQFYAPESFKEIVEAVDLCFPNKHQAHGEILVIRDDKILSRSTGNGVLNHVRKGGSFKSNEKPFLNLWDIVSLKVLEGEEKGQPYAVRYAMLKEICYMRRNILQVVPNRVVYSYAEAIEHFKEIRSKGGEGTVIKHPDGLWQNTTSRFQVKVKDEKEADLRVIGKNAGKGKNITTFGSLICITEDEQLLVSVSGFTDKQREEINENFDKYLYRIIPVLFTDLIKAKNSETYSMENPRVDSKSFEVRTDKDEADTLDRLLQM